MYCQLYRACITLYSIYYIVNVIMPTQYMPSQLYRACINLYSCMVCAFKVPASGLVVIMYFNGNWWICLASCHTTDVLHAWLPSSRCHSGRSLPVPHRHAHEHTHHTRTHHTHAHTTHTTHTPHTPHTHTTHTKHTHTHTHTHTHHPFSSFTTTSPEWCWPHPEVVNTSKGRNVCVCPSFHSESLGLIGFCLQNFTWNLDRNKATTCRSAYVTHSCGATVVLSFCLCHTHSCGVCNCCPVILPVTLMWCV